MNKIQNPKYGADDSGIFERSTKIYIPHDEPVFILRGKDKNALATLIHYQRSCSFEEQRRDLNARVVQFENFTQNNPVVMSEPGLRLVHQKDPQETVYEREAKLRRTLNSIAEWELPKSTTESNGLSFEAEFGLNGVKAYLRSVARQALTVTSDE